MSSTRFPVAEIQSWTPALDARAVESNDVYVVDGRNYYFDSKGPKSGFGNRVLSGGSVEPGVQITESLEIGNRVILFTSTGAYDRRWTHIGPDTLEASQETWHLLKEFDQAISGYDSRFTWTGAFVGNSYYACHPSHGIYQVFSDSLEPWTPDGLPDYPIAIAESQGRLLILSRYNATYSNSFDAEDLTPALGGSGFQVIREIVPGNPFALTSFQGGFLVWTTGGVILAEFVGGDVVFRFDRVKTDLLMLDPIAWTTMASGSTVLCTEQGLFESDPQSGMKAIDPKFNEFFRQEITKSGDFRVKLMYIRELDHLYVQIQDWTTNIIRTYVLAVALDKWGTFDEEHRGIVRFSGLSGDYGYIDMDGYGHRFLDSVNRELIDGTLVALESWIELGYIRPASGGTVADIQFEIQEVLISAIQKSTDLEEVTYEDWNGDTAFVSYNIGFYNNREDWNNFGVLDYAEDWNNVGVAEDWNLLPSSQSVDWNDSVAGTHHFDWNLPGPAEDWNDTPPGGVDTSYIFDWEVNEREEEDEDWNSIQSFYIPISYGLELKCNLDGWEPELSVIPALAVAKTKSDLWTCFSHGHNHRLIVSANQNDQKYHVTQLALTIFLAGRIA